MSAFTVPSPVDVKNLFSVDGVAAVVTGGGTGIGLMIAQALEANGAKPVYIVGRRADVLQKAAETARFGNIIPHPGDVTSKSDMKALVSRIEKEIGRLDVLVHCAGSMAVSHTSNDFVIPEDGSIEQVQKLMMSEAEAGWATQFAVNVTAVYFLTASFLGLLKKGNEFWGKEVAKASTSADGEVEPARTSQVITTTGIAAYFRSFPMCMGYAASKAAVQHMMKTMATTFAPADIRFNSIAPGIFPTEITAGRGCLDDRNRNYLGPIDRKKVPQGRAGDPKDMAGAVLYLCGRGGYYCNGMTVVVDGGRLSVYPSTY